MLERHRHTEFTIEGGVDRPESPLAQTPLDLEASVGRKPLHLHFAGKTSAWRLPVNSRHNQGTHWTPFAPVKTGPHASALDPGAVGDNGLQQLLRRRWHRWR